jgi:hypothetical protein
MPESKKRTYESEAIERLWLDLERQSPKGAEKSVKQQTGGNSDLPQQPRQDLVNRLIKHINSKI